MFKSGELFAMLMTTFCWVILCVRAYRNEEVYNRAHGVVHKKVKTLLSEALFGDYFDQYAKAFASDVKTECYVKTFETTNSDVILLDFCNKIHGSLGHQIYNNEPLEQSETLSMSYNIQETENGSTDGSRFVTHPQCFVYNITSMRNNSDIISNAPYRSCSPWNIRHLIRGVRRPILSIINIYLKGVPILDLLKEDLAFFPNLRSLFLRKTPLASESLEKELLCSSLYLQIFHFWNSLGYLRKFPSHIFNCSEALSITMIDFIHHNIAYLPAYAFQSAAQSMKWLFLVDIGLETIHKDAFFGVLNLEVITMTQNRITSPICTMIPPSEKLKIISLGHHHFNSSIDFNVLKLDKRKHLSLLVVFWKWSLSLQGRLCSSEFQSSLKTLRLRSDSLKSLLPPLFDDCVSLKYLELGNALEYFDVTLFARNVSLEELHLSHNKLTDNISWSGLLAQQQQLWYLNLSWNSFTSWTQNISAVWQLKQLDISHNNIALITPGAFENLTRLELLSLEGNRLYESDFLCVMPFLHVINLAENLLKSVDCLSRMRKAHLIDVSSNNISELVLGARQSCPDQCLNVTIHAENNMLTSIILPCSDTQHYTVVDLSNNKLTDFLSIFPDIRNATCHVEVMNVSGNSFDELMTDISYWHLTANPASGTKQHHVATLDMTHCGLRKISPRFGYYFVLSKLHLEHNKVVSFKRTEFPRRLDGIRPIIDLRNNQLVCDCDMHWLKEHLKKQSQKQTSVEYSVSYCSGTLWFKSELIQSLPDDMFLCLIACPVKLLMKCTNINCYTKDHGIDAVKCSGYSSGLSSAFNIVRSQIHINGGHIPTLELTQTRTTGLKCLNLTSCNITNISSVAFSHTPNLQILVLSCNLIQSISRFTLDPLVNLRYLDLSHNLLRVFEANIIHPLRSLETVSLHSNKLTNLDHEALHVLQRLKNISLHNNPWKCTCNSSFKLWVVEHERILKDPRRIQCDGSGSPVMLSNALCTQVYISTGLTGTHVVLDTLGGVLVVTLIACTVLCNKYRFELSVLWFTYMPNCFKYPDNEDGPCGIFAVYDDQAYVAYMWVKDDLIPHVQPACPLICYDRDFLPGIDMMDNVEDAINRTNCAVVLLTERFLQNHWSIAMFQGVFITMMERQRPYKIIPVLGHDVTVSDITSHELCPADLRVLLKTHWVLDLSKMMFWESLLYLLPDSCKARILGDPNNGERDLFLIQTTSLLQLYRFIYHYSTMVLDLTITSR